MVRVRRQRKQRNGQGNEDSRGIDQDERKENGTHGTAQSLAAGHQQIHQGTQIFIRHSKVFQCHNFQVTEENHSLSNTVNFRIFILQLTSHEEAARFKVQDPSPVNTIRNETRIDMSVATVNNVPANGSSSLSNLLHRKKVGEF